MKTYEEAKAEQQEKLAEQRAMLLRPRAEWDNEVLVALAAELKELSDIITAHES